MLKAQKHDGGPWCRQNVGKNYRSVLVSASGSPSRSLRSWLADAGGTLDKAEHCSRSSLLSVSSECRADQRVVADNEAAIAETSDDVTIGTHDNSVTFHVETCNVAPGNRIGVLVGEDEDLIVQIGEHRLWI